MISQAYIEVGASLLLLVFLLWKEGRRSDRSRLAGRVVATVLAVAALVGMVLPLHYYREVKVAPTPVVAVHQEPLPRGVVVVDWQRRLAKGERLQVQGKWAGKPVKLLLMGLGGVMDSVVAGGDFSLGTVPAQAGRALYQLVAVSGADTLEREDIPVQVETRKPLKILVLAAAPGFENKFLINWLASDGQQVASRTAVSTNSYQSSYMSMVPRPLDVLTPALLDGFDVVIADSSALPAAGSPGMTVLRRQVEEKGLGLIIRLDSADPEGVSMGWGRVGLRVFARDSSKRATIAGRLYGSGKVVFTTLNATYAQVMKGQRQAYAAYWSTLLRRVSGETEPGEKWQLIPALPRVGEPVTTVVQTDAAGPVQGLVEAENGGAPINVYMVEGQVLPFEWRGTYWPATAGWQMLHTLKGDTTWVYFWPRSAWAALYGQQRSRAEVRNGIGTAAVARAAPRLREAVVIPAYWFYVLFFLSVLFLWVERKMAGMNG
jgi:hypothetical protein